VTIGMREGHKTGRAGHEFELRGNWGRGVLLFCLLQGNYLYKFLQNYETEGTVKGAVQSEEGEEPCMIEIIKYHLLTMSEYVGIVRMIQ
jgi:hypothetical protein